MQLILTHAILIAFSVLNIVLLAESVMLGWANHIKPPRGTRHHKYSIL